MFRKFINKRRIGKGLEIEDSIMTVNQENETEIEVPFKRKGLNFLWYLVLFILILLAFRVFYLNFFRGEYYKEISKGNRIRSITIKSPRGMIFDKQGKILAKNIPSMDVIAIPGDLPKNNSEKKEISRKLADILEINHGNIEIILNTQDPKSFSPILIKGNVPQDQALIVAENKKELPGIEIEKTAVRFYENGIIFSHIIGYDGKITREELNKNPEYLMTDYIGKTGLEKKYEEELRGKHGFNQVEINSLGNIKRNLGIVNPLPGNDLTLNIDEELQKKIYDNLSAVLEKSEAKTGSVVAIDPKNGGVLAMVSIPSYDNNIFAKGISNEDFQKITTDNNLPLLNRSAIGEYPPGSTFKPVIAAGALNENNININTTVNDNIGALHLGSWRFGDWKTHGIVNVKKAIAESCNVFFYSIGGGYGDIKGLGISEIKKYANLFGFGEKTGIDLPSESAGLIPDEEWKINKIKERWYIGDTYHASIGQGFITATPLQLANFTASIANGGTLYSPKIVKKIKKNDGGEEIISPEIINENFIRKEVMEIVREGMKQTVIDGTAKSLQILPVSSAGKTGTAQFGKEGKTHSWFTSFAPYENSEIAMAVLVEEGGDGSAAALSITRDVLEWYFNREK